MPIDNITQSVSTIPAPPHRGVDVQTVFVNKQEDFQDHLADITIDELNTLKDQLNTRIGEINSTATTMNGYADTASAGASTATTKAGEASTSASGALTSRNQAETFKNNASASATKASQWADNNYNVEVETGRYSAKHWSIVAQNATEGKVDKVTSTDNAIVRFDGASGNVQNSTATLDDIGNLVVTKVDGNSTTQAVGNNSTKIATTAFVNAEIANDAITKDSVTGVAFMPSGTTAQRPTLLSTDKAIRFNTDLQGWESWNGNTWGSIAIVQPAGAIIIFAASNAPAGYLKCNGALLSRTTYAALFAAIGTTFGAGDGSTTFALPDLRGYFPRGWDDGRGIDTSRVFGSNQEDDFKSHNHTANGSSIRNSNNNIGGTAGGVYVGMDQITISSSGGAETRPKNIALLYCIKY